MCSENVISEDTGETFPFLPLWLFKLQCQFSLTHRSDKKGRQFKLLFVARVFFPQFTPSFSILLSGPENGALSNLFSWFDSCLISYAEAEEVNGRKGISTWVQHVLNYPYFI